MNIYVGNLPAGTTVDELRDVFVIFGEVVSVSLMNDRYIGSGQPCEYGYVQMPSKSEGQAAVIALQDKRLRGQLVKIIEALPLSDRMPAQSKRGRNVSTRRRVREG